MFTLVTILVLWAIVFGFIWIKMHTIVWWEWLAGVGVGFITVFAMYAMIKAGMMADIETWSGHVTGAQHEPRWTSSYQRAVYTTDSEGNSTFSHYETVYVSEGPSWWVNSTLGNKSITKNKYNNLKHKFGGEKKIKGDRSGYSSGPKEDDRLVNVNKYIQPLTELHTWENRVKAAPSIFQYQSVPEDAKVFPWPRNADMFNSDRLMGTALGMGVRDWDLMNGRLGAAKKVNVIAVGFPPGTDSSIAQLQEAAWIGGKKNDLVICFGGNAGKKADWSYSFGWSEEELVKRNLESLFVLNEVNSGLIPKIEKEIRANYIIKDWSKFDYLEVEVPFWGYFTTLTVLILTQGGLFFFFHSNEADEDNPLATRKPRWRHYR